MDKTAKQKPSGKPKKANCRHTYLKRFFSHWSRHSRYTQDVFPLNKLPNELLLHIIANIDPMPNRYNRVLGHIPDDPPPSRPDPYLIRDFLEACRPLWSLSLTSRRFRELAQSRLYTAPVLGGFAFRVPVDRSHARIAYFLRTLFARPDLRKHVKHIRLCFPGKGEPSFQREEKEESNFDAEAIHFVTEIVLQCRKLIASFDLPSDMSKSWNAQMIMDYRYTLTGILLALLPQLETLSFSEGDIELESWQDDHVLNMIGIHQQSHAHIDLRSIKYMPAAQSLRHLKVSSLIPIRLDGLDMFANLDSLDISIKLAGLDTDEIEHISRLYSGRDALKNFRSIRTLRFDCQIKSIGIWDFAARSGMVHILQVFPGVTSLSFYAEPSSEKNPFRSVRAFPHYQANIQTYPTPPKTSDYDASVRDTFWDERVYAARTEWTDYQFLVDSLYHIRPKLETLQLPGGFWTLPGAARKPLPRFDKFSRLKTLVVPQAALMSIKLYNMRLPDTGHGDFDLLPDVVFPATLKRLTIFDANEKLLDSAYLDELFAGRAADGRKHDFELEQLEILFGPMFTDEEIKRLLRKSVWPHFWAMVDRAKFKVLLGRDGMVPAAAE